MDYKEKLEKAKELYPTANADQRYVLESLFPELKESEDERIKKVLVDYFKTYKEQEECGIKTFYGIPTDSIIAWLEKQGEQKPAENIKPSAFKDKLLELFQRFGWYCKDKTQTDEDIIEYVDAHIQELIDTIQNHTDKVEPKFEIGDWVIDKQGIVHQIVNVIENVTNHTYGYDIVGGGYFNDNTEGVRLWTIQDAKDGDVLCSESGWTCIFRALDNHTNTFSSYCFMDSDKWFCNTGCTCHTLDEQFIRAYNFKLHPATKEQRDLLFQKMEETGYEWDADKKELKEIKQSPLDVRTTGYWHVENTKQNPAWSEEDERIYKSITYSFVHNYPLTIQQQEFVKSLKPQNTWKPSEEQIKALHDLNLTGNISYAGQGQVLIELYNDLKKLAEE